jgi:hypothetical protein
MPDMKIKREPTKRREAPLGVKIISILLFINSGLFSLFSLIIVIFGIVFTAYPSALQDQQIQNQLVQAGISLSSLGWFFIFAGLFIMLLSILFFFIALGLWRGRVWARVTTLAIIILGVFVNAFKVITGRFGTTMILDFVTIIFYIIVFIYLALSKEAKVFFKAK